MTEGLVATIVDGQRRRREPPQRIELLDAVGLERRMTPLPLVFEHASMAQFYAAGGWVETVPAELEEHA